MKCKSFDTELTEATGDPGDCSGDIGRTFVTCVNANAKLEDCITLEKEPAITS